MDIENQFKITDDYGKETVYDVLFTFDNEESQKSYIVFTDNSLDDNGNINVFAKVYKKEDDDILFEDIETDKEYQVIEKILETIKEEVNNSDSDLNS